MNTILKCEKLNKSFGRKHILKDVSLELDAGDILGFIGPNGSGKTTTIKLILGLQSIDSGTVIINGFDNKKDFVKSIKRVGAIIESPDLYMYLSGRKNLELIAIMYPDVDKKRIDEVISLVKLDKRINDKVSKYSLGMRQRLGIAQAIIHNPNLLILDEPTNGLDPEGIKDLRDLLKELADKEHMGILISSHNLSELESFCNKVCIIKNGAVIENNTIKSLKKKAKDTTYIIEVNSNKKIKDIIKCPYNIVDETTIRVHTTKENIPSIIEILIKNSIKIYEVKEEELSLEEAFLNKTGGNTID